MRSAYPKLWALAGFPRKWRGSSGLGGMVKATEGSHYQDRAAEPAGQAGGGGFESAAIRTVPVRDDVLEAPEDYV
jgi:hypothetical protein